MEVSLVEADGLPKGCLLSIRAGSTRRQAPADPEKFKLAFPKGLQPADVLKVDLLEPLGGAVMNVEAGMERYDVSIDKNGSPMKVGLLIRAKAAAAVATASATETPSLAGGFSPLSGDRPGPADSSTASRRHLAALSARRYLDSHKLLQWAQVLFQELIRDQPEDPWAFIDHQTDHARGALRKERSQSNASPPMPPACKGGEAARSLLASSESVTLVLVVENVSYEGLFRKTGRAEFTAAVKDAIADEAGPGINPEGVELTLSSGSVTILATIAMPPGVSATDVHSKLQASRSLGAAVSRKVAAVKGIEDISTGPIRVTRLACFAAEPPAVVKQATPKEDERVAFDMPPLPGSSEVQDTAARPPVDSARLSRADSEAMDTLRAQLRKGFEQVTANGTLAASLDSALRPAVSVAEDPTAPAAPGSPLDEHAVEKAVPAGLDPPGQPNMEGLRQDVRQELGAASDDGRLDKCLQEVRDSLLQQRARDAVVEADHTAPAAPVSPLDEHAVEKAAPAGLDPPGQPETEVLRQDTRAEMCAASDDGRLDTCLKEVRDPLLQQHARDAVVEATGSGHLDDVLAQASKSDVETSSGGQDPSAGLEGAKVEPKEKGARIGEATLVQVSFDEKKSSDLQEVIAPANDQDLEACARRDLTKTTLEVTPAAAAQEGLPLHMDAGSLSNFRAFAREALTKAGEDGTLANVLQISEDEAERRVVRIQARDALLKANLDGRFPKTLATVRESQPPARGGMEPMPLDTSPVPTELPKQAKGAIAEDSPSSGLAVKSTRPAGPIDHQTNRRHAVEALVTANLQGTLLPALEAMRAAPVPCTESSSPMPATDQEDLRKAKHKAQRALQAALFSMVASEETPAEAGAGHDDESVQEMDAVRRRAQLALRGALLSDACPAEAPTEEVEMVRRAQQALTSVLLSPTDESTGAEGGTQVGHDTPQAPTAGAEESAQIGLGTQQAPTAKDEESAQVGQSTQQAPLDVVHLPTHASAKAEDDEQVAYRAQKALKSVLLPSAQTAATADEEAQTVQRAQQALKAVLLPPPPPPAPPVPCAAEQGNEEELAQGPQAVQKCVQSALTAATDDTEEQVDEVGDTHRAQSAQKCSEASRAGATNDTEEEVQVAFRAQEALKSALLPTTGTMDGAKEAQVAERAQHALKSALLEPNAQMDQVDEVEDAQRARTTQKCSEVIPAGATDHTEDEAQVASRAQEALRSALLPTTRGTEDAAEAQVAERAQHALKSALLEPDAQVVNRAQDALKSVLLPPADDTDAEQETQVVSRAQQALKSILLQPTGDVLNSELDAQERPEPANAGLAAQVRSEVRQSDDAAIEAEPGAQVNVGQPQPTDLVVDAEPRAQVTADPAVDTEPRAQVSSEPPQPADAEPEAQVSSDPPQPADEALDAKPEAQVSSEPDAAVDAEPEAQVISEPPQPPDVAVNVEPKASSEPPQPADAAVDAGREVKSVLQQVAELEQDAQVPSEPLPPVDAGLRHGSLGPPQQLEPAPESADATADADREAQMAHRAQLALKSALLPPVETRGKAEDEGQVAHRAQQALKSVLLADTVKEQQGAKSSPGQATQAQSTAAVEKPVEGAEEDKLSNAFSQPGQESDAKQDEVKKELEELCAHNRLAKERLSELEGEVRQELESVRLAVQDTRHDLEALLSVAQEVRSDVQILTEMRSRPGTQPSRATQPESTAGASGIKAPGECNAARSAPAEVPPLLPLRESGPNEEVETTSTLKAAVTRASPSQEEPRARAPPLPSKESTAEETDETRSMAKAAVSSKAVEADAIVKGAADPSVSPAAAHMDPTSADQAQSIDQQAAKEHASLASTLFDLEQKIRERNARFRRENEAMRSENARLRKLRECGEEALKLGKANDTIRSDLHAQLAAGGCRQRVGPD